MPAPDSGGEIRRLAAIMFTDMVGYSALTQRNEALSLELLEEHRRLVRAILPGHQGREVKTTGDGFLLEFSSALAAAECAVQIQRNFAERNQAVTPERQIQIRIGIHLGDLVQRGGDVYGDGVNIAARIEPLAEPGGICLTNAVYEQIVNKVEYALVPLPRPRLKNIETPVQVYKLVCDGSAKRPTRANPTRTLASAGRLPWFIALGVLGLASLGIFLYPKYGGKPDASASATPTPSLSAPALPGGVAEEKSVAVLPFVNMSSDKENEYLSDGITEELLNSLARIPGLHVPARTSSFAFKGKNEDIHRIGALLNVGTVLEGSVRRSGNRLRITAELIKVSDGYRLWSDSFDRDMKDVFDVQEEIARTIVGKLKVKLIGASGQPLVMRGTENIEAWQLYLKGRFHLYKFTEEDQNQAISYFQEGIKKQPDYAKAYTGLAQAYVNFNIFGYTPPQSVRPMMNEAIAKALELDDTLGEAHNAVANVSFFEKWNWPKAEREFKRAIELNPASLDPHYDYAEFLMTQLRYQEALTENAIAQRIDPLNSVPKVQQAFLMIYAREYDRALTVCKKATTMDDTNWFIHEAMASALFRKEDRAAGIAEMEKAVRLDSGSQQLAELGRMYGQTGRKADALRVLNQLLERRKKRYVPAYFIALAYEGLGDFAQANIWMNRAIEQREFILVYLNVDADETIRANPYFPEWVKKVGFDASKP